MRLMVKESRTIQEKNTLFEIKSEPALNLTLITKFVGFL